MPWPRFLPVFAGCALCVLVPMLVGASCCLASEVTRANAGMAALQNFYKLVDGILPHAGGLVGRRKRAGNNNRLLGAYRSRRFIHETYRSPSINNRAHNFLNDYYDDEGWWTLTWIKAYDLTGNTEYLNAAKTIFADMAEAWDPIRLAAAGSGGTESAPIRTQLPMSSSSQRPRGSTTARREMGVAAVILDWAQREWNWFAQTGMINSSHLVNDGLTASCKNNGRTAWSYNQGVILGGLADLYQSDW